MPKDSPLDVGKRERQLVEAVYRLQEASVAEVRAELESPPSYSAVRAMLNLLVEKKVLKYRQDGRRYVYRPAKSREKVSRSALQKLVTTFFGGNTTDAMAALLDVSENLTRNDLNRMRDLIEKARKEQR